MSQQYPGLKLLKSEAEKCLEDEDVVVFLSLYVLLYADDIIVMAENESDLQLALNAMQQYCNDWKLVVNVKKTKVVLFSKGKVKKHINFMYMYNGERVEVVDNYTYLGITLNFKSNYNLTIKKPRAMFALLQKKGHLQLENDTMLNLFV